MSDAEASVPDIEVRRGAPTPEELAALVAVIGEAYRSESSDAAGDAPRVRSRWELSTRGLRQPLPRERGWGGFAG